MKMVKRKGQLFPVKRSDIEILCEKYALKDNEVKNLKIAMGKLEEEILDLMRKTNRYEVNIKDGSYHLITIKRSYTEAKEKIKLSRY